MPKHKLFAFAVAALLVHQTASAADVVSVSKITRIENGWLGEGVALRLSGPGITGCPADPVEFAIGKDHPGYREIVAIALAAQSSSADVELVVEKGQCLFGGRTKVLSVRLYK